MCDPGCTWKKDGIPFRRHLAGFTLLEVFVASAVLGLVLVVMLSLLNQTSNVWRSSNARIEAFQSARRGFENMTSLLEQATLNTYWDYDNPNAPSRYIRQSELHFLVDNAGRDGLPGTAGCGQAVFFQAPANRTGQSKYDGLLGLLNACGFFVLFGSDAAWLPRHVEPSQARERFRLMQWMQGTESLRVYNSQGATWIPGDMESHMAPLADNVIALVVWPREEGMPAAPVLDAFSYDSRQDGRPSAINQLPPLLQVALVAIDEPSAIRLGSGLESSIQQCLDGLFQSSPSARYLDDIRILEGRLAERGITYRTFVSAVPLREAKWSP